MVGLVNRESPFPGQARTGRCCPKRWHGKVARGADDAQSVLAAQSRDLGACCGWRGFNRIHDLAITLTPMGLVAEPISEASL